MLNTRIWTWTLGIWTSATYLICVTWGLITPEVLHMHSLLETVLPGFRWLSPTGFVVGLVESFLYGACAGLLFTVAHNFFHRRWEPRG
jgi:hypothetical protein